MVLLAMVGAALAAAIELVLPLECGGCGQGQVRWCVGCRRQAAATAFAGGARLVAPQPCPATMPATWAATVYAGPLRRAIVAYKDEGRHDLAKVLAPWLWLSVAAAVEAVWAGPVAREGPILLVPVPSSPASIRRRGDRPLEALLRHVPRRPWADVVQEAAGAPRAGGLPRWHAFATMRACGHRREATWRDEWARQVVVSRALRVRRRVADQAGLSASQRSANLHGAVGVDAARSADVVGATCVVVDDVVTTGATLVEAARALREGGAVTVVAAAIAATQRHHPVVV